MYKVATFSHIKGVNREDTGGNELLQQKQQFVLNYL